uniref:Uncharacterized protein n=1 Tax=Globodera rostochiensis TaxID=31243 RepID=A0A914HPZ3_GLORO
MLFTKSTDRTPKLDKLNPIQLISLDKLNPIQLISLDKLNLIQLISLDKSNPIQLIRMLLSQSLITMDKMNQIQLIKILLSQSLITLIMPKKAKNRKKCLQTKILLKATRRFSDMATNAARRLKPDIYIEQITDSMVMEMLTQISINPKQLTRARERCPINILPKSPLPIFVKDGRPNPSLVPALVDGLNRLMICFQQIVNQLKERLGEELLDRWPSSSGWPFISVFKPSTNLEICWKQIIIVFKPSNKLGICWHQSVQAIHQTGNLLETDHQSVQAIHQTGNLLEKG